MLSKIQSPKTKQELIRSLSDASIQSVTIYEGPGLSRLPSRTELERAKLSVIVVKLR